jgi:hypothetical protein
VFLYGALAELVEGTFLLRKHRGKNSDHWFESNTLRQFKRYIQSIP